MPTPLPLFIVHNAAAGHTGADECIALIRQELTAAGRAFHLLPARRPQDLPRVAREAVRQARDAGGAVVVAGGDGSVHAAVQQVLPAGVPFGVIPVGTFNYFARAHGIPEDVAAATRALLTAQVVPVQVGRINEEYFTVNAGLGVYAASLADREAFKQRLGRSRLVAFFAGLATLLRTHPAWTLQMEVDGRLRTVRAATVFIANNPLQLAQLGLAESDAPQQGRLVAVLVPPRGPLGAIGLLLRGLAGRLGQVPEVSSFAFRELRVRPGRPYLPGRLRVGCDGETLWLRAPLRVQVAGQPLHLLQPAPAEGAPS
jgi:diacylglycerol kinase family enzyme